MHSGEDSRTGHGDPVLLLSGLGSAGSHLVFHPYFSDLAGEYRIIYVDLHGRGCPDHPERLEDVTFAGDVADMAALVPQLDGDARELPAVSGPAVDGGGAVAGSGDSDLRSRYPKCDDFLAVRDRLDPHRMFGNAYTEQVFGP